MTSQQLLLEDLQRRHRACTACVKAGFIERAHPVFSGQLAQRFLVVGQAPGPVEVDQTRPFAGRAGKQLMRWFAQAGFGDEGDVRRNVYFTSMTTCFPGRNRSGNGDRRPSAHEVALCSHWLDELLGLLKPRVLIPVGTLSLARFMPGKRLDDVVGRSFSAAAMTLVPLPHPSGQSRWLNDPGRVKLLNAGLGKLSELRQGLSENL